MALLLPQFTFTKAGRKDIKFFLKSSMPLTEDVRHDITFEMIQHRFTKPAKRVIQKNYPKSKLELDEEKEDTNGVDMELGNISTKKMRNKN